VARAVAVLANAGAQPLHFGNKGMSIELREIFIHN
jgi:hypothetical protein